MVKKTRNRRINEGAISTELKRRLESMPRIGWELLVLSVLLLIVFLPSILRWMAVLAPLVPAPQPAFVFPLWSGSANYNLTLVAGQSFASMSSQGYNLNVWSIGGVAGEMSSSNYVLQLGAVGIVSVPAIPGLAWADSSASPPSPTVYDASQSYTFLIRWGDDPTEVTLQLVRYGVPLPVYSLSQGTVEKNGDIYSVTIPSLRAGNYTYLWSARNATHQNSTPVWNYVIEKASSAINLTLDGDANNETVVTGSIVQIVGSSLANPALPIELRANFSGSMVKIAEGVGTVAYALDTANGTQLPLGRGLYRVEAVIAGNENWTTNSTSLALTVVNVSFSNPQVSPASGVTYEPRTYYFNITCEGYVSDVLFELDGSNLSATRSGSTCLASVSNLSAGMHTYRWYANDTLGNWYSSDVYTYNIAKANATLTLLLNGMPRSLLANIGEDPNITIALNLEGRTRTLSVKSPTATKVQSYLVDATVELSDIYGSSIDSAGHWNITGSFAGDMNHNPASVTRWIAANLTDNVAPSWSNVAQSTDNATYGSAVIVSADWQDDVLVDWVWLSTNVTGAWANGTPIYIGAPFETVRFEINATAPPGSAVGWRIWANDTSGKINSTSIVAFSVIVDTVPPFATNQTQVDAIGNTSDNKIGVNDTITLKALCSDETLMKEARLATNESGVWRNVSTVALSGQSVWAEFVWQNASVGAGKPVGSETAVGWRIYCLDYSNNAGATGDMTFVVKVFDEADADKDGIISQDEVLVQIARWKAGQVSMAYVMRIIDIWIAGGRY